MDEPNGLIHTSSLFDAFTKADQVAAENGGGDDDSNR